MVDITFLKWKFSQTPNWNGNEHILELQILRKSKQFPDELYHK